MNQLLLAIIIIGCIAAALALAFIITNIIIYCRERFRRKQDPTVGRRDSEDVDSEAEYQSTPLIQEVPLSAIINEKLQRPSSSRVSLNSTPTTL
ncbi:hypothetical protein WG66_016704 [Moniliophthora roreri]|uniref:Uncharacterized protein n=1 Tax=Moniliophthora roreri TaxID=221103 RepID=A0A0W0GCM4_MONRR|nr:hypothetical protein WG66_016704 [Moniliophthora roreri]